MWKKGYLVSAAAAKEPEDTVYRLYYAFRSPLNRVQGHQVLAINRGEREGVLKVSVEMEREAALIPVRRAVLNPGAPAMAFVRAAAEDAYDRLIFPSVEREMRGLLTEQADEGAIKMFGLNLKPLLMQPPVKGFVTMGLDPGYQMCIRDRHGPVGELGVHVQMAGIDLVLQAHQHPQHDLGHVELLLGCLLYTSCSSLSSPSLRCGRPSSTPSPGL